MLSLVILSSVGIIIISTFILIIGNKPDFWFWLFLNLYFDPGGYVEGYLGGKLLGPLIAADVFIVGIIICLISAKVNWRIIFGDKFLSNFLLALFIFSIYYFIVYGGIVPYFHNDFNYSTFLIKNRLFVYGLIILIAVYVFSLRNLRYFYSITLSIGFICLSFYLITLLTGFDLIFVWELKREGTAMIRKMLLSYGLFRLTFPLALTVYLISKKNKLDIKYKHWLYFSGILMLFTELITLTRRTQIDIIGLTIIILLLISYLFRSSKLKGFLKLVIPVLAVSVILFFTLPDYTKYIKQTAKDTFSILTTGENSLGQREERVTGTGDLEITKEYIMNNLLFGTGYTHLFWLSAGNVMSPRGKTYAIACDAAKEVPIYYLLFGFGVVGAILIFPLYFIMATLFLKLIKLLRIIMISYLDDPLTIIFSIYILLTIAVNFTINLYQFGSHFIATTLGETAVILGLGFAIYRKLNMNVQIKLQ